MHAYIHAYIHTYIHTHAYIHNTYIYIHNTYIHIYTYIYNTYIHTNIPESIYTTPDIKLHTIQVFKERVFPEEAEKSKNNTHYKTRNENSTEVSKFRPFSLINAAGKVLEKILINRIMYHIYSNNLMNPN